MLRHEVPTSLLPSFLTSTLKAPASALGLIEGISDALAALARFGGGALGDDPSRRRRVAVGGYATTAVLASAIGVAAAPWQAGVFRAAAWSARVFGCPPATRCWPIWCPQRPMAGPTGSSGRWITWGHRRAAAGDRLIAVVNIRTAIFLSVIPGLLSAVAIVYAIRHTKTAKQRHHQPIRIKVRPVLHGWGG